jgi:hypothetical protein
MKRVWLGLLILGLAPWCQAMETIRLGFHAEARREWTRAEVRGTFDLWAQELAAKFQIPVRITHYDDVAQLRRDLVEGRLDGVQSDIMSLVRFFEPEDLAEGYASIMKGGYNLVLYAGASVGGLADLAGKRVVLLEQDEAGALYLETLCLRHYRRACKAVFADIQKAPTSNQALMRVFFAKADLALVHSYGAEIATEMNPRLLRDMRPLAEYRFNSQFYGFYSPRVDKAIRERTLRVMPTLHTYPRGRQLLDIFKIDHLVLVTGAELEPARRLEREYRELSREAGRPGGRETRTAERVAGGRK